MSLANLFNIPRLDDDLSIFSFSNADQHRLIAMGIQKTKGISLPIYLLDPIPVGDIGSWARAHQAAHTDYEEALGIAGFDYTDVDFNDPEQLAAWIRLHAISHQQAAQILGL